MLKSVLSEDLFALKSISQPLQVGDLIFYVENGMDQEENDYTSIIKSISIKTQQEKVWGNIGRINTQLTLSPDQKQLAFTASLPKKSPQLYVMALDGGAPEKITEVKKGISSYLWQQDSRHLLFTSTEDTLEKPKIDPKRPLPIEIKEIQYKLNGAGFLPENQNYVLSEIEIESKTLNKIFSRKHFFSLDAVSKDQNLIVISEERLPNNPHDFSEATFVYNVTTKKRKNITHDLKAGAFSGLSFSPDQKQIILLGTTNEFLNVSSNQLYRYDIQQDELVGLTTSANFEVDNVVSGDFLQQLSGRTLEWLDDQHYLFLVSKKGVTKLYQGDLEGHYEVFLSENNHITDFSYQRSENALVYTISTPTIPSLLRIKKGQKSELVLNPNEQYQEDHYLAPAEAYHFTSEDAVGIDGWLLKPQNAAQLKKYPAILYVHGGPKVCYGETFFHEMQVHVAQGYAVVMLNPRGGASYGDEFANGVIAKYGQGDFKDLMQGLDEALKLDSKIDATNLFEAGGSYGGFMTNWIETHTDRFKAVCTQRSISNWISFYGTSDIGYYFTPWELKADLTDIQTLWEFSPLAHVKQAKTPILILHSEEDYRCPMEQGEQFYTALKLQGVTAKFVRFPQSNHDLSRAGLPHLRMERLKQISEWFDFYRKQK